MLRPLGKRGAGVALGVGCVLWIIYASLEFRHLYLNAIRVPPTQRIVRNIEEVRLPHLYFCPADRGRLKGFQWHSYECLLTYKDDRKNCPAWLQSYRGRTPEVFRGNGSGGACLEFGTHMIGIRREWSAAWNEITLRAAFNAEPDTGLSDNLQEVELGYLPVEWDIGAPKTTAERFYYPLLRVPLFFLTRSKRPEGGVATRSFIAKEVDRGLKRGGRYWYTYGTMQIAVLNASLPAQTFEGASFMPPGRVGVVHVVLSLEDFEEFDFEVVSCLYPLLSFFGEIAGVAALLAWVFTVPFTACRRGSKHDANGAGGSQARHSASAAGSASVGKWEYRQDGDSEEEEGEALLGEPQGRPGDESTSDRPLLRTDAEEDVGAL